jgi:hypothetical protein
MLESMRDDPDEAAKELRRIIEADMTLAEHAELFSVTPVPL